jgi:hypothetical protein
MLRNDMCCEGCAVLRPKVKCRNGGGAKAVVWGMWLCMQGDGGGMMGTRCDAVMDGGGRMGRWCDAVMLWGNAV